MAGLEDFGVDELALGFLEQWLTDPAAYPACSGDPPTLNPDVSLVAIEHLVSAHRELFKRHTPSFR